MNTNLKVKRILCFGDSLTYGANPADDSRFDAKHRWTGVLQDLLGIDYEIIEEGLGGRTTDIDDPNSADRNGFEYFRPCLQSTLPLHLIILLLGTNDLKNRFNRNAAEIANSLVKYFEFIDITCTANNLTRPKVILLSPPLVEEKNAPSDWDFKEAGSRSEEFAKHYQALADKYSSEFLDLSKIVQPSKIDGVHLNEEANRLAAASLSELIKKL